jgi:uncharacterized protein YndB with AHSA1/START domain
MPATEGADGWVAGERPGDGAMRRVGNLYDQRFVRLIPTSVERVWAALTVPERLAEWLGQPADLDLRVGGRYFVRFVGPPNDDGVYGVITAFERERVLAYDWNDTGGDTNLRWELNPEAEGCRLQFTQTGLSAWWFIGGFAGWHSFLDDLCARLVGEAPPDQSDVDASYRAIEARYRAWFGPFVIGADVRPTLRHNEPEGLVTEVGDGRYNVRFVRRYMLPIAKLWATLTEPERLDDWVGTGDIVERKAPGLIEWALPGADDPQSLVRCQLTQEDPRMMGCRVALTHSRVAGEELTEVLASWRVRLHDLPDAAARADPPPA